MERRGKISTKKLFKKETSVWRHPYAAVFCRVKYPYLKMELKGEPCNLSLKDLELVAFLILG